MEIADLVARHKDKRIQNLMRYVDFENLMKQHLNQENKKAVGIDKVTKQIYNLNANDNLKSLVERMKIFAYKPLPVKRVYIPKSGSNKLRPLGIPSYEDKLVQGAFSDILNEIYEPKFLNFSYGFRKNRSCHQAIKELRTSIMTKFVNYVVDADIKGFFDNINHKWLIKFLEHDIADKNFIRYIRRFLNAGIMENGIKIESDKGAPQGGLISPILANVYLHYVLDLWFDKISKCFKGYVKMVRYADDFVVLFQYEYEAKLFYKLLTKRLDKFGLEVASDKSKIIPFGRFSRRNTNKSYKFDFLGFTFINTLDDGRKYSVVLRTNIKKLKDKYLKVKEWFVTNMHTNEEILIHKLNIKLTGHYRYYGISTNSNGIRNFYKYVMVTLFKTLNRRSQRISYTWKEFNDKISKFIAKPRIYVKLW